MNFICSFAITHIFACRFTTIKDCGHVVFISSFQFTKIICIPFFHFIQDCFQIGSQNWITPKVLNVILFPSSSLINYHRFYILLIFFVLYRSYSHITLICNCWWIIVFYMWFILYVLYFITEKCAVLNQQTKNLDSVDCKAPSGCPEDPYNPSELWNRKFY